MDSNRFAMQDDLIVHEWNDWEGRHWIQTFDGQVFEDSLPHNLTNLPIFAEQQTLGVPGEVAAGSFIPNVPDQFDIGQYLDLGPYPDLDLSYSEHNHYADSYPNDFDRYFDSLAGHDDLELAHLIIPVPTIPRREPIDYNRYFDSVAGQDNRAPAQQSTVSVPTNPGPISTNAPHGPELFTAPYPKPATHRPQGRVPQLFDSFKKLKVVELQLQVLKYALKASRSFIIKKNGQIDSRSSEMQQLLYLSHITKEQYPGLLYRQNIFVCLYSNSVASLLRQPDEVIMNILHIDLLVGVMSKARMDELDRLPNLKTIRIITEKSNGYDRRHRYNYGYHHGYDPNVQDNATIAQRLEQIELTVKTTLNTPAVYSNKETARFVASQRAVRQIMKKKRVEILFVARYSLDSMLNGYYRSKQYETVFEVKLGGAKWGYWLHLKKDDVA